MLTMLSLLLLLLLSAAARASATSTSASSRGGGGGAAAADDDDGCELYLAPSPLKEAASHGYGLGVFTGRHIVAGEILIHLNEVLVPFYDSSSTSTSTSSTSTSSVDASHPPLREYLWPAAGTLPELAVVGDGRREGSFWFASGISSVSPCTSSDDFYNVRLSGSGWLPGVSRGNLVEDEDVPSRRSSEEEDAHRAGSYSYRHSLGYVALRDIFPGEEFVVACNDDDFDEDDVVGYEMGTTTGYNVSDAGHMCLDNVRSGDSEVSGKGIFATRRLSGGETILSSPVVPAHRKELIISGDGAESSHQLLLNYALGRDDSDLLLLPYGPLFNYVNHPPPERDANAVLRWHTGGGGAAVSSSSSRRLQYHHPELFRLSAEEVARTHGKGLVIDIVALDGTTIEVGDEIYVDYGDAWTMAWADHARKWEAPPEASTYLAADQWFHRQPFPEVVKTVSELEREPYPENLQTICYYDNDPKLLGVDEESNTTYTQWRDNELPHECMRPCDILERYVDPEDEDEMLYAAEMFHFEGESMFPFCDLTPGRHVSRDVTYDGILIVDRPGYHDTFLEGAFRHEVGVPGDLFPREWLRPKVRRRKDVDGASASASRSRSETTGNEFRKKKVGGGVVTAKMLLKEERSLSARADL